MSTTTRAALRYPAGTAAANVPVDLGNLANDTDALLLLWYTGTTAGLPGAATNGRLYYQTDGDRILYDMGSAWRKIMMQTADGKYTADTHVNATGFEISGTALASTHLSDTAALARLAGPTFTGVPAAPTAAADTNTTQLATTAYVLAQLGSANPLIDGTAAPGSSTRGARQDHVHPTDTSRAPLASPTLTGTPAAPTAAADTNTTQVATTAFVLGQASAVNPAADGTAAVGTSTRFARADHVHPTDTSRAPLASPTLTGTPAAPTAAPGTNTTQIATTAFVIASAPTRAALMTIPGNISAVTNTTYTMGGLAVLFTPNGTRMKIDICGAVTNTGNNTGGYWQIKYGAMGSAPTFGAADTGTPTGAEQQMQDGSFTSLGLAWGLTPGQQYWIDLRVKQYGNPTDSVSWINLTVIVTEP